jgi:hypothetical protein
VDGFNEDHGQSESDDRGVILRGFLASECDTLEALELADGLLDAGTPAVEGFWEEGGSIFVGRPRRDHGADATRSGRLTVGLGVVALVADGGARRDVWPEVEQDGKMAAVARLAGGQIEGDWETVEVGFEMDLGREAASRPPKSLAVLPPFAPAAETWARAVVESNICTRWAVPLVAASMSNIASKTPDRESRQKRFQTAFQSPNSTGNARQVMLWTVK